MPLNDADQIQHTVIVHTFAQGDVEEPDIFAASSLLDWQNSEPGQWILSHAVEQPVWHRTPDHFYMGYRYHITAKLTGPRLTEWLLRWSDHAN